MKTRKEVSKKQYFTTEECIEEADKFINRRYDKSKLGETSYAAIRREFINHYLGMTLEDYEIKSSESCAPTIKTGLSYFLVENVENFSLEQLIEKIEECEIVVAVATDKIGEQDNFKFLSRLKERIQNETANGELKLRESYGFSDCETNQYTLSIQKVLSKNPTD